MKVALISLLAFTLVSSGCARSTRLAGNDRTFCARSTATVYVQNDNWMDVVIYAVRGSSRFRLGQVSSVQTAKFELPTAVMGGSSGLYLLADPVGAVHNYQMFATDDIMIAPGHTIIDLRVDSVIDHSSWSVAVEDPEEI